MQYYDHILETIGRTPLVRLHTITAGVRGVILAKLESFNPGHSIKDRIAIQLVQNAEQQGQLKKHGTIIERSSGNTGIGLALVASVKGYRCICVTTEQTSQEKLAVLQALGAEVHICPSHLEPDDPHSYYMLPQQLVQEIPNAIYIHQHDNIINYKTHYQYTGPEIWQQTDGRVTHCIMGVGTGGTITGVGKFLKEKNPSIKIFGIDSYGSMYKKYYETAIWDSQEGHPYFIEGIGENRSIPRNIDFSIIDGFIQVSDQEAMICSRKLALTEGLLMGYSSGAIMHGTLQLRDCFTDHDVVVLIFPDHGCNYLSKIFNDNWVRQYLKLSIVDNTHEHPYSA